MTGFKNTSYSSSSDSEEEDNTLVVTKKSLEKAIAMIKEDTHSSRGDRVTRVCQSSCLRDLGLRPAAENCSPGVHHLKSGKYFVPGLFLDSPMVELLEELRMSLLTHDDPTSAKILEWFLHSATKIHLPIIWRTAAVLFLKHHCSHENREAFLEKCAGKFDPEDKVTFVETLVSLNQTSKGKSRRRGSVVTLSDEDDPCEISK